MSDHRPTWRCTCGRTMRLAFVQRSGWGIYRCDSCKREAIETAHPHPSQTTGQNSVPKSSKDKQEAPA